MKDTINRLRSEGADRIAAAGTRDELESVRVALLGRKGEVTGLLRGLKDVPDSERPRMGAELNRLKIDLGALLDSRQAELDGAASGGSHAEFDLTLPGTKPSQVGTNHPLMTVLESICDITLKAIREAKLALMTPVMTSTDGLCVAKTKCIPTARAI